MAGRTKFLRGIYFRGKSEYAGPIELRRCFELGRCQAEAPPRLGKADKEHKATAIVLESFQKAKT